MIFQCLKISDEQLLLEIQFKISNPNPRSAVIVQTMDYHYLKQIILNLKQISGGEIGSRPTGMVEFGSNYYFYLVKIHCTKR